MFYNHLIFSKVTLSLRICLKYLVSLREYYQLREDEFILMHMLTYFRQHKDET